jgi:hypothetical protein
MTIHYSERPHGRPWHLFGTPNRPAFHACHRFRGLVHLDLRGVDDPSQFDYQPQRAAIQRRLGYNSPAPHPHTDRNTGTIERWTTRRRRSAFSRSNRFDLTDAERAEWGRRFGVAVARGAAKDAGNRPTDRALAGHRRETVRSNNDLAGPTSRSSSSPWTCRLPRSLRRKGSPWPSSSGKGQPTT